MDAPLFCLRNQGGYKILRTGYYFYVAISLRHESLRWWCGLELFRECFLISSLNLTRVSFHSHCGLSGVHTRCQLREGELWTSLRRLVPVSSSSLFIVPGMQSNNESRGQQMWWSTVTLSSKCVLTPCIDRLPQNSDSGDHHFAHMLWSLQRLEGVPGQSAHI